MPGAVQALPFKRLRIGFAVDVDRALIDDSSTSCKPLRDRIPVPVDREDVEQRLVVMLKRADLNEAILIQFDDVRSVVEDVVHATQAEAAVAQYGGVDAKRLADLFLEELLAVRLVQAGKA